METQKQPCEDKMLIVHPVHGERLTEAWVVRELISDAGSGWSLKQAAAPVPELEIKEGDVE